MGQAREFACAAVADWGLPALSADVRLCASELVGNAIRHPYWDAAWGVCRSCVVTVTVWRSRRWLVVDVMDGDPSPLVLPSVPSAVADGAVPEAVPSSGRGLWMVCQCADGLTSWPLWIGGGKVVRCWWNLAARGLAAQLPGGPDP